MRSAQTNRPARKRTTFRTLRRPWLCGAGILGIGFCESPALLASVTVYGGPTYDSSTSTGYFNALMAHQVGSPVVGNGTAVGWAEKYSGGTSEGSRAFRIGVTGAVELGHLGTDGSGTTASQAVAINAAGTAVGRANLYTGGTYKGFRAVRWDASSTAAIELGNLGVNSSNGFTTTSASAINANGTAVGSASKYDGSTFIGGRPVRWDVAGTVATELGNLGTNSSGVASGEAVAVNSGGTTVGSVTKYNGSTNLGIRAVRWDALSTVATELDNLGANFGYTDSAARAVNASGAAFGYAKKWGAGSALLGHRAVRWDASGTAATELGTLGTDPFGATDSEAYAANDAGTAVGFARKPGPDLGYRAVRWDASGAVTELGNLGTASDGNTDSSAFAINAAGAAVGYAQKYTGGTYLGARALLWRADGLMIDLNSLLSSTDSTFWTLEQARGISDTNWVGGLGNYDPDGSGPLPSYRRAFLLDASSVVPEPGSIGFLALGGVTLLRRRRRA
jgi:hypothetical protein